MSSVCWATLLTDSLIIAFAIRGAGALIETPNELEFIERELKAVLKDNSCSF
jgi:hypothetical protein